MPITLEQAKKIRAETDQQTPQEVLEAELNKLGENIKTLRETTRVALDFYDLQVDEYPQALYG